MTSPACEAGEWRRSPRGSCHPAPGSPRIRQLAGDLGLAPGTVARAYRELEAARRFAAEVAPLHLDVEVAVTAVRAAFRHQEAGTRTT